MTNQNKKEKIEEDLRLLQGMSKQQLLKHIDMKRRLNPKFQ